MADFGISGLASGFDWRSFIDRLLDIERTPQRRLATEQNQIQQRQNAYSAISTQLKVLQNRVEKLQDDDLYGARTVTNSDDSVATASAAAHATTGSYRFVISQLATSSRQVGSSNAGGGLSATSDVSGVTVGSAPFPTRVTEGVFTVNGKQVSVAATDSLQDVFDAISTATSGAVTASYDPDTDRISLSSAGEIVLGSAADTSNFLTAARLYNNGSGAITSSAALGSIDLAAELTDSNLATAVTVGGTGEGLFKINGVEITYDLEDSLTDIIDRINASSAGVTASYDVANDRFLLTNEATGDLGIGLEDVTGNFLAATGLSGGALTRGNNLLYTVNGGTQLVSASNTITEESSGISGLTVTALAEDTVTLTVAADTEAARAAITDFIEEYNRVQSVIDDYTASTTDSKGKVTAGVLANDLEANALARQLRSIVNSSVEGLSSALQRLESIGITSNGDNNKLSLSDEEALDDALTRQLDDVKNLFAAEDIGLANVLADFLEDTVGDDGSIEEHQDLLTEQIAEIDTQISDQERQVQATRERLIASFVAMERAQQQSNQQLQYLLRNFSAS